MLAYAEIEMQGDYYISDNPDTGDLEGNLTIGNNLNVKNRVVFNNASNNLRYYLNSDGITANGTISIGMGYYGQALNGSIYAGGYGTAKDWSVSIGNYNTICNNTLAVGNHITAKEWYWPIDNDKGGNVLIGAYNNTVDIPSTTAGQTSYFTSFSMAAGVSNVIGGSTAFALGYKNTSKSTWVSVSSLHTPAISIGKNNTAVDNTILIGDGNVGFENSYSFGFKLQNYSEYMITLGRLNTVPEDASADSGASDDKPLVVIGNGHVEADGEEVRSDAVIVKKSGDMTVNGKIVTTKPSEALSMGRFGRPDGEIEQ